MAARCLGLSIVLWCFWAALSVDALPCLSMRLMGCPKTNAQANQLPASVVLLSRRFVPVRWFGSQTVLV